MPPSIKIDAPAIWRVESQPHGGLANISGFTDRLIGHKFHEIAVGVCRLPFARHPACALQRQHRGFSKTQVGSLTSAASPFSGFAAHRSRPGPDHQAMLGTEREDVSAGYFMALREITMAKIPMWPVPLFWARSTAEAFSLKRFSSQTNRPSLPW